MNSCTVEIFTSLLIQSTHWTKRGKIEQCDDKLSSGMQWIECGSCGSSRTSIQRTNPEFKSCTNRVCIKTLNMHKNSQTTSLPILQSLKPKIEEFRAIHEPAGSLGVGNSDQQRGTRNEDLVLSSQFPKMSHGCFF